MTQNVPFASERSNLTIFSKQEVWDYRWEALVLMSKLLLFLFMCWFASSDSQGTASNYIFVVAICGLMVFLIDLSQAYHSVVAAIILERQNMADPHLIFHFSWSKYLFYTLSKMVLMVHIFHAGLHVWTVHLEREANVWKRWRRRSRSCCSDVFTNTKGHAQCVIVHCIK